jgi:hypothetical protein
MKKIFGLFFLFFLGIHSFSQAPDVLNYQAVVRDASGQLLKDQDLSVRISILQGSVDGSVVYSETFSTTSNAYGLIRLRIGEGATTDDFSAIDWSAGPYFLRVAIDPDGGTAYTDIGTTQLLSVPYALHAKEAGNVFSGDYGDLTNTPDLSVYLTTETDPEVGNNKQNYFSKWDGSALVASALYETGSQIGTPLLINANGGISTGALTLNGTTKTYWDLGEAGKIPYWVNSDSMGLSNLYFSGSNAGIGTATPAYLLDVAGTARVADTLHVDSVLTLGHWTLSSARDTMIVIRNNGTGTGLQFMIGEKPYGTLFTSGQMNFSLRDNDNAVKWYTRNLKNLAGNIYFRDGLWSGTPGHGEGKIEYFSNRFYMSVPANSPEIVRFRINTNDVAFISRNGSFYGNMFFDLQDIHYYVKPSDVSKFNNIYARNIYDIASPNNYYLRLSGVSKLNSLYVSRITDLNNASFYLDPNSISYLNRLNITSTLSVGTSINVASLYAGKIYDRDNSIYYLDPYGTSNLYHLTTLDMTANMFKDRNNTNYYMDPSAISVVNYIRTTGNIGIGGNYSNTYRLYIHGSAYCTGSWAGSDIRWKKNIEPLQQELPKILQLQGVHYRWRSNEFPEMGFDDHKQIGLIAQEVEKVFPELVNTDDNGYKAVSYEKLTVVLLEALKEQQKMIEEQQKSIEELKKEVRKRR